MQCKSCLEGKKFFSDLKFSSFMDVYVFLLLMTELVARALSYNTALVIVEGELRGNHMKEMEDGDREM